MEIPKTSFETNEGIWTLCPRRGISKESNIHYIPIISKRVSEVLTSESSTELKKVLNLACSIRKQINGTSRHFISEYFVLNLPNPINRNAYAVFNDHQVLISTALHHPNKAWKKRSKEGFLDYDAWDWSKYENVDLKKNWHHALYFPEDLLTKDKIDKNHFAQEYYKILEGDMKIVDKMWYG